MILGVVLATGAESRFGREADLLAIRDGRPAVAHAVDGLLDCSLDRVVGVTRSGSEVDAVLDALGVRTIYDADAETGRRTSVPRAVEVARLYGADAILLAPGDVTPDDPEVIERLLARYRSTDATIVAPNRDGRRGEPVLFDETHFDALAAGDGEAGDLDLLGSSAVTRVDVDPDGAERRRPE